MSTETIMKIGIASDDIRYTKLFYFIKSYADVKYFTHRNAIPQTDNALDTLIKEWVDCFDIILIPLTFQNFGSLRIAELIHRNNYKLKTILVSESSNLYKELAVPLFDSYINLKLINENLDTMISDSGGFFVARKGFNEKSKQVTKYLSTAIEEVNRTTVRITDYKKVEMLISALLTTQGCFRYDPYSGRHPELAIQASIQDYKSRIYLDDLIHSFPRGAHQSQVDEWKAGKYNITINGSQSRVNIASMDSSSNIIGEDNSQLNELLLKIAEAVNKEVVDENEKNFILNSLEVLRDNKTSRPFSKRYNDFIQSAANHITILSPFIPALSSFLG